ncbi:MAG TPA: HEAT repeat domain-containing protein [Blastocatellia bacterium]|nr:HEAT repeat domain-containing protein [Blastocatellia bacterium]
MSYGIRAFFSGLLVAIMSLPAAGRCERSGLEGLQNLVEQSDSADSGDRAFNDARTSIDSGEWRKAEEKLKSFVELFEKHRSMPAALYYLAFALKKQNKLARADETIERLMREYPRSSWARDARKMRVEIASATGEGRVIEDELKGEDVETKVIVLQGLFVGNPERAIKLVTEILKPDSKSPQNLQDAAVALLGQHRGNESQAILTRIARDEKAGRLRETAIFWLGMGRDDSTFELLKELARSEDESVSRPAIMALSQRFDDRGRAFLWELARAGTSMGVRKQALFWLGRRGDDQTLDALIQVYDSEKSEELKQQIILSLGMQRSKKSLAKLMDIVRTDSSRSLRTQAVFWIGQSSDPEAMKFLEEILK